MFYPSGHTDVSFLSFYKSFPNTLIFLAKWRNFDKFGHTDPDSHSNHGLN